MLDNNISISYLEVLKNYDFIFTFIGSVFTVLATLIALYALLTWRRQQKYTILLNYLIELEDNYEILFANYIEEYHWFLKLENTVHENKIANYANISKKELDKFILDEYNKKKLNNSFVVNGREYELAYLRAKRFFSSIQDDNNLQKSYLDKHISKISDELAKNNDVENLFKIFAEEILKIKENAIDKITNLRSKI